MWSFYILIKSSVTILLQHYRRWFHFHQSLPQHPALDNFRSLLILWTQMPMLLQVVMHESKMPKPPPTPRTMYHYYAVLNGGLTNTTISPLTNNIPTFLVFLLTISSPVSSSSSMVVMVSSTWDRTMLRCWSYACRVPRSSRELRHLMYTRSDRESFIRT